MKFPDQFVRPNYSAGSIANIPATVAEMFEAPFEGLPSLPKKFWQPLTGDVKRVILLVVDGFGWNLLEKERSFLEPLLQVSKVTDQLTSIFPSTTVAALSSLWTGVGPATHSMVGLRLFFEAYGTIGQMLKFSPTFGRYPDALIEAGLDPQTFLKWPGFAEQLAGSGIITHSFKNRMLVDTALSQMHGRGVSGEHGILTPGHMFVEMRRMLEAQLDQSLFISAYLADVDMLSHGYGWNDACVAAELRATVWTLQEELIQKLSPQACDGTVLLITADHGQVVTPPEHQIYLEDYPTLRQMLFMKPAGEPRVVYLYTKHGRRQEVIDLLNNKFGHALAAFPSEKILEEGLLGPRPHAAVTFNRIADVTVIMRDGYALFDSRDAEHENHSWMRGRHGGLTADEMYVPWIGFRLDR